MCLGPAARIFGRGVVILLISGFAGATLVRFAPGFGVDEEVLDARLSPESIKALEGRHAGEQNPLTFYLNYLRGLLHGDAGQSVVFGQPVALLFEERAPTTLRTVVDGLLIGWVVGSLLAVAGALSRRVAAALAGTLLSGALVCIPAALLATVCLFFRLSPSVAIAAVILPRVYPHVYEQVRSALAKPHVVMARARGVPAARLFWFHIAPGTLMPLTALAGVSVTVALGASIPIEALADSPGIGQLAWARFSRSGRSNPSFDWRYGLRADRRGFDLAPSGKQAIYMTAGRTIAATFLGLTLALSLGADWLAPHDYAMQFRDHANEPPSRNFFLGTDGLGRDRFSRLLYATRASALCAPAAALMAMAIAAAVGLIGGFAGGWVDEVVNGATDLFLSLPWLFALLTLRSLLPLNASSLLSLAATFILLAAVGWASCARVVRAAAISMSTAGPILHARAYGCSGFRLIWRQMLPNLRPILSAQFWILVPVFLLTEANLGMLGLGIAEPMPSLGNMLAELQDYQRIPESPWILAPAVVLVLIVASLHLAVSPKRIWE